MKKIIISILLLVIFMTSSFFIYTYHKNKSKPINEENIIDCSIKENKKLKECLYFGDSKIIINRDGVISTYKD